ncbi:MAG: hypothetical protein ACKPBA_08500, partial [Planctomycetota bacterium]
YQPGVLLIGEPVQVVVQVAAAIAATIALAAAAESWLGRTLPPAQRLALAVLGLAMIWPATWVSLGALALFAGLAFAISRAR